MVCLISWQFGWSQGDFFNTQDDSFLLRMIPVISWRVSSSQEVFSSNDDDFHLKTISFMSE